MKHNFPVRKVYLPVDQDTIQPFTKVATAPETGFAQFDIPEFSLADTEAGTYLLNTIDISPDRKTTDIIAGVLQEVVVTKSLKTMVYNNYNLTETGSVIRAGAVTQFGIVLNPEGTMIPVLDGEKVVPVLKSLAVVIAPSYPAFLDMQREAEENRQEIKALMIELFPKVDIFKSLFATESKPATTSNQPSEKIQNDTPAQSDTATPKPDPIKTPGQTGIGQERPGHKYLQRKENPAYPGRSKSKYIYLYKLASGREVWRDDQGNVTSIDHSKLSKPKAVWERIKDSFTGAKEKAQNELSNVDTKQDTANPYPEQKPADFIHDKPSAKVDNDQAPEPEPDQSPTPSLRKGSQVRYKNSSMIHRIVASNSNALITRDENGRHDLLRPDDFDKITHISHPDDTHVFRDGQHWNITHAGRLIHVIQHPETGKKDFYQVADHTPQADDFQSVEDYMAYHEGRRKKYEADQAEKKAAKEQKTQKLASIAKFNGYTNEGGRYVKRFKLFGGQFEAEMFHDGQNIQTRFNGNTLQFNAGDDQVNVTDINPEKGQFQGINQDGIAKNYDLKDVSGQDIMKPGRLKVNEDGSIGIKLNEENSDSGTVSDSRINLDHLGEFSPIQLVTDHHAAFLVKNAIFAQIGVGDHVSFVRIGELNKGVVAAKGKRAAGVLNTETGSPQIVNASQIHNVLPHDETSEEFRQAALAYHNTPSADFQEKTTGRDEAVTKYKQAIEGHQAKISEIKQKMDAEVFPANKDRYVTELAQAEMELGTAKEAVLRAQMSTGNRIPNNIIGYHEARKQKEGYEAIANGHKAFIAKHSARFSLLAGRLNEIVNNPEKVEEISAITKEMTGLSKNLDKARSDYSKITAKAENAKQKMNGISASTGGFIPSSLHELSVSPSDHGKIFEALSNPANDLKDAAGGLLPQYASPESLHDVITAHLDAANEAPHYLKNAYWSRIGEFLNGSRLINGMNVSHDYTHGNRPFTPEEIARHPELENLNQIVKDPQSGTELISAMAREIRNRQDIVGTGLTEKDAIEQHFGTKLEQIEPEYKKYTSSIIPKTDDDQPETEKPVAAKVNPVNPTASPVLHPDIHTKTNLSDHKPVIDDHFSQQDNQESLGNLEDWNSQSAELGQSIKDDQQEKQIAAAHFTDENGTGLDTHETGTHGDILAGTRAVIENQAKQTDEPIIASMPQQEDDNGNIIPDLHPGSVLTGGQDKSSWGTVSVVNPMMLKVHKVKESAIRRVLEKNRESLPAGTDIESVIKKLNFAEHGHEHTDYQGRDNTDSQRALDYALRWDPSEQESDPIYFHSPDDGKTNHVFSGNHRTLAAQLHEAITGNRPTFYGRQFNGTKAEAVAIGDKINNRGVKETDRELAYKIRKWSEESPTKDFVAHIREKLGYSEKDNAKIKALHTLSHLDKEGSFWGKMEDPVYKEMKVDYFANFMGSLRKTYPQLTHQHEQEVFDHLFNNRDNLLKLLRKDKVKGPSGENITPQKAITGQIDEAVQQKLSDSNWKPETGRLNLNILSAVDKRNQAGAKLSNLDERQQSRYNELKDTFESDDSADRIDKQVRDFVEASTQAHTAKGGKITADFLYDTQQAAKQHIAKQREEHDYLKKLLFKQDDNQGSMFGEDMFKSLGLTYERIEKSLNHPEFTLFAKSLRQPQQPGLFDEIEPESGTIKTNSAGTQVVLKPGPSGKNRWLKYEDRVKASFEATGTQSHEWSALPILGFRDVDAGGQSKSMPIYDFGSVKGYEQAKTPFSNNGDSDNMGCELCAHPIKTAYHIKHDGKKLTMVVGSECVGSFGTGKTGKDNTRDAKLTEARMHHEDIRNVMKGIDDHRTQLDDHYYNNIWRKNEGNWRENAKNIPGIDVLNPKWNSGSNPHRQNLYQFGLNGFKPGSDDHFTPENPETRLVRGTDNRGYSGKVDPTKEQNQKYRDRHFKPLPENITPEDEKSLLAWHSKNKAGHIEHFKKIKQALDKHGLGHVLPETPFFERYSNENPLSDNEVKKSLLPAILSFLTNGDWEEVQKAWYKIKQVTFAGLPISIENAKGTYREGTDKDGHDWKVKMYHDYGYIRRTEGTDGDQIDVYLGPDDNYEFAYIVHQNDPVTGKFDEDKVMLGFQSAEDARKAYQKQYDRPGFFGSMEMIERETFEKMVRSKEYKGKPLTILPYSDNDDYTSINVVKGIPDGEYDGLLSGYGIVLNEYKSKEPFKFKTGVRGMNIKAKVSVKDGKATKL